VAPLRFGAGVKGKVIDCLAAGLACACTPVAAEGLDVPPGWIGYDAAGLAARILALHEAPPATLPRLPGAAAVAAALAAAVATARLDRPAG